MEINCAGELREVDELGEDCHVSGAMRWLLMRVLDFVTAGWIAWFAAYAHAAEFGATIEVYDPSGRALHAVHAALGRTERGEGQARLLFYGASHVASDTFTGTLRRMLQDRFGDAGHGFVLPAPPWRSYRHRDVNMDGTLTWWADWVGKGGARPDGLYGLAGVSLSSNSPHDYARVATTTENRHGRKVSRFEVYYLEQPGGGRVDIRLDGRLVKALNTSGLVPRAAYLTLAVEDGGHSLELVPHGDGEVRIFGVTLDRDVAGVVVDTVGINGHRAENQLLWHEGLQMEHLRRRRPDLVVLAYGTNESGDDHVPIGTYEQQVRAVVTRVRRAVPEASCLLIGPSDRPLKQRRGYEARPRQRELVDAQKRVAAESGCAFFDLIEFMGGLLSMPNWVQAGYASKDHVHFTSKGYDRLAEVLHEAILRGYQPPD